MAITQSRTADRTGIKAAPPWPHFLWLATASILIAAGLFLVYKAKSNSFAEIEKGLATHTLLNLNDLNSRDEVLPFLTMFPIPAEREFVARKIYYASGNLPNAGALRGRADPLVRGRPPGRPLRTADQPLLTAAQFQQLKPHVVVRSPARFTRDLLIWTALFIAAFVAVQAWWQVRGFTGDRALLTPIFLLTGAGLILMVSLRDPVRDTMLFADFAQGVVAGCALLAALSFVPIKRLLGNLSFVPLIGSFVLSILLLTFGHGPGTSDSKVNLLGFQPVELIRILLVLFLAGYFAPRWEVLRHARETRPKLAALSKYIDVPPLEYFLPVLVCVTLSLLFFFLQKDLGPALVFACLFLTLYAVARGRVMMLIAGLAILVAGFTGGYLLGVPHTVSERVSMWLSPWNNFAHGGDQLAHSLWAFSTGGAFGTGLGLGDPALIPAGHTDLVLSALGEEWGYAGLLAVFALYTTVLYRAFRIALRASSDYDLFLATGLAAAIALQLLLIAGGALGVLPLSGVVTPFLSYGRTSMLANFVVIGMLLSISRQSSNPQTNAPFRIPLNTTGYVLAAIAAVILAKATFVQVLRADPVTGEGVLITQADGVRRYQYNPRLLEIMREVPKGAIYDRTGLPLATSAWSDLEAHRAEYVKLGVDIDRACSRADSRHYPFGGLTFDLLGDLRTRVRWAAPNTSFVERDSATRLRGYDDRPSLVEVTNPATGATDRTIHFDYRELVPLLRHRYQPDHPAVRRVLDRPRDVRMSIDAGLQVQVAQVLREQLRQARKDKGAIVVLDPASGDLLASVSYPLPADEPNLYLDRARYGLYPPGSTFKVITAMAALRKDPALAAARYSCVRLPDGRVGNVIRGSNRPVRDDVLDTTPHGTITMERAITVSCNAYFAQLGTYDVGAQRLLDTARLLGITMAAPATPEQLRKSLPQSSYGQGQVVASPFQMARAAAAVANGGMMPEGRWITDETNKRLAESKLILSPDAAATLGRFMREAVTTGTGSRAAGAGSPIAGKTGTAELASAPSHAWFIGFAPYGTAARRIAFSILIENGQYGGTYPAAAAPGVVAAAGRRGLMAP